METDVPNKTLVRLSILSHSFSLKIAGDPQEYQAAADAVESLLTGIAKSGNVDTTRAALLTSLHLALRVRVLEREMEQLRQQVDERTRRMAARLSEVVPGGAA